MICAAWPFEPDAGDRAASGPTSKAVRVIPTKVPPQGDFSPRRPPPRRSCGFRRGRAQSRGLAFGRGLDLVRDPKSTKHLRRSVSASGSRRKLRKINGFVGTARAVRVATGGELALVRYWRGT